MSAPQAFDAPIYVTRPYLPELSRYQAGLEQIWANRWLTNNGPILQDYNKKLEARLGTPNVCLFNNGTLALQIALQGMRIQGEVITTPFTFVATAHCLYWNSVKPVFVDIDPTPIRWIPPRSRRPLPRARPPSCRYTFTVYPHTCSPCNNSASSII